MPPDTDNLLPQSLNDFKSASCLTPFAYGYLWFSLVISMAVYAVDTFTAVNLLLFNKWSSDIELTQMVPFDVAKWIFSGCIILSVVNLFYEHLRANRVMRRGSVAECYLDSLAARLESIRFGKGQGYKRFLVFAELTKSKKGAEYVALFSYFSFQCKSPLHLQLCFLQLTDVEQHGSASSSAPVLARQSMRLRSTRSTLPSWRLKARTLRLRS
jgi:hypothetical protein